MSAILLNHRALHRAVLFVEEPAFREDRLVIEAPGHDGDKMSFADKMGGGAVDDDVTGAFDAFDDVGFESRTVGDGGDEHFFAHPEVGGPHEIGGDGNAAFVFDVGISDSGAMKFGFELST
ncbi:hypothetical protein BH11VER1_BH11VER1_40620 [soil metagenome]